MKNETMTFESAMEKLDGTVRRLESGSLPLSEALAAYEEAIGLVRFCNGQLEDAEQKVRILTEGEGGTVTDAPFAAPDET
ncbi:MAG TPA: exodeoxyribonuclease VII small subunit [Clostridiales bacterium]|nr:exodeoxyribonuclease VII small subunit [Clostridiales bacterium]